MTTQTDPGQRFEQAAIEADPQVPIIHIRRDFHASIAQLMAAHTDPELFAQWVGPDGMTTVIDHWDARTGGSWRYVAHAGDDAYAFRGTFHEVGNDRIVQTFSWEEAPDNVALERLTFEEIGEGITRLHATSLCDSFEARDMWLASGMEIGVNDGYAKLDALIGTTPA